MKKKILPTITVNGETFNSTERSPMAQSIQDKNITENMLFDSAKRVIKKHKKAINTLAYK